MDRQLKRSRALLWLEQHPTDYIPQSARRLFIDALDPIPETEALRRLLSLSVSELNFVPAKIRYIVQALLRQDAVNVPSVCNRTLFDEYGLPQPRVKAILEKNNLCWVLQPDPVETQVLLVQNPQNEQVRDELEGLGAIIEEPTRCED